MTDPEFIATAGYGDPEAARQALAGNPDLARARTDAGVSVLAATVYASRLDLARELAAVRDDLDLFEAACLGDTPRALALLEDSPTELDAPAPDGFSALGFAAFFGHVDLAEALLARGADVERPSQNPMRVRPLHSAVAHADRARAFALAERLLEAGADPNTRQQDGMTPLHETVHNRDERLTALLVAHGADPDQTNDAGESPRDQARSAGEAGLLRALG